MNPLNPEAGDVPIPTDLREMAAAVRAADVLYRAFPYYGFRYGERGQRFAHSDAGYLLSLVERPQAVVDEQLLWLAGVLASRGMPSWLLEMQLRVLARTAARALGRVERYRPLREGAEHLRAWREAKLPAAAFAEAGRAFAADAGLSGRRFAEGTGRMVACAVADEANGIAEAVPSLARWLGDPALFDARWRGAVERTAELAREACRAGGTHSG